VKWGNGVARQWYEDFMDTSVQSLLAIREGHFWRISSWTTVSRTTYILNKSRGFRGCYLQRKETLFIPILLRRFISINIHMQNRQDYLYFCKNVNLAFFVAFLVDIMATERTQIITSCSETRGSTSFAYRCFCCYPFSKPAFLALH